MKMVLQHRQYHTTKFKLPITIMTDLDKIIEKLNKTDFNFDLKKGWNSPFSMCPGQSPKWINCYSGMVTFSLNRKLKNI